MDNKLQLQINNTALEDNNTDLNSILSTVQNLPTAKAEQEKTITPSATIQEVVPDDGKTLSKVTVNGEQITRNNETVKENETAKTVNVSGQGTIQIKVTIDGATTSYTMDLDKTTSLSIP